MAATLDVFKTVSKELLPTPAKSHYTFNLRDLAKVRAALQAPESTLAPAKWRFLVPMCVCVCVCVGIVFVCECVILCKYWGLQNNWESRTVFNDFSSSKLVQISVEIRCSIPNYFAN